MTYVSFLGGIMTTFSFPVVAVVLSVTKYPFLVLLFMAGSFFWVFGALLKASVWMAYQDSVWGTVIAGICIDAACRILYAWTYTKLRPKLLLLMDPSSRGNVQKTMNYRSAGLVGGLGYGSIQAIALYGLVLSEATGPATYYLASCPHASIFLLQGVVSLCFVIMSPFLQYAAMHALHHSRWVHLLSTVGFYALASLSSVASSTLTPGMCGISAGGAILAAIGSIVYSACVLHRNEGGTSLRRSSSAKLL